MSFWYHVHGALTHFPIALAMASFAFDFAGVVGRNRSLRTVGFWTILLAAFSSLFTVASGLIVAREWSATSLLIHRNTSFVAAALMVVLALWRGLRRDEIAGRGFIAYLVVVALAAGAVGLTGYLGGNVVMGS